MNGEHNKWQFGDQGRIFCIFFIIGLFISFIFDIFRSFRKSFKLGDFFVYVQDIAFLFITGILIFRSIIVFNNGSLRFYLFFAIFLGIIIYSLTLSNNCVIIITVILNSIKLLFKIIWKLIKAPYYFLQKTAIKYSKKHIKKSSIKNPIK